MGFLICIRQVSGGGSIGTVQKLLLDVCVGVPTSDNWLSLKFRAKNVRSERIMESKSRIESSHFIFQSELIHCSFPVKFLNGLRSNVRSLHCINLNFPFFLRIK